MARVDAREPSDAQGAAGRPPSLGWGIDLARHVLDAAEQPPYVRRGWLQRERRGRNCRSAASPGWSRTASSLPSPSLAAVLSLCCPHREHPFGGMERFLVFSASFACRGFLSMVLVGSFLVDGSDPDLADVVTGMTILVSALTVLFTYFMTTLAVLDDKCCASCKCCLKSCFAQSLRMMICFSGLGCWLLFIIFLLLPEYGPFASSTMRQFGISMAHSYTWQFLLLEIILYAMARCSSADEKRRKAGKEVPNIDALNRLARGEKIDDLPPPTLSPAASTTNPATATATATTTTTASSSPASTGTATATTTTPAPPAPVAAHSPDSATV